MQSNILLNLDTKSSISLIYLTTDVHPPKGDPRGLCRVQSRGTEGIIMMAMPEACYLEICLAVPDRQDLVSSIETSA